MTSTVSAQDPIKHVVLLLLENHSFDQMLGCFNQKYPDLDGVNESRFNTNNSGKKFGQVQTKERQTDPDPHHEVEHVRVQLEGHNGGFVKDFEDAYHNLSDAQMQQIMGYYPRGFFPALHGLAEDFT